MAVDTDKFSVNLRYLLWQSGRPHDKWVSTIVQWLGCPAARAFGLLTSDRPTQTEADELAERLGVTSEDLRFNDLLSALGDDLFFENLRYLVNGVEHGDKQEIARRVGVHNTSLSRWISGSHRPDMRSRQLLAEYFGLTSEIELTDKPLFLSLIPISEGHRKKWLAGAIDAMDQRELNELFPALYKLLS
jgi:transcriptional regulator with XRE-family HTH domain